MARKRSTIVTIIVVLLLLALAAGIIVGIVQVFGNDDGETFGITVNGKRYERDAGGLILDKTTTVAVTADEYEISLRTQAVEEDFIFHVGDEEYTWSDTVYHDFTPGFGLYVDGNTFTLTYTDLAGILSAALSYDVNDIYVPDVPTDEDLFVLSISSGESEVCISFTLADLGGNANADGVTLDRDHIIF